MSVLSEFKDFITKGNVVDLAVAFVIGMAFTAVVTAFVADIITPLIGVAGHFDFSSHKVTVNGSAFLVGAFTNSVISFLLIAAVVFFVLVRPAAAMEARRKAKLTPPPATTRECPYCLTMIPKKARRCSSCTSEVTPEA